jgi:hypothetical protein
MPVIASKRHRDDVGALPYIPDIRNSFYTVVRRGVSHLRGRWEALIGLRDLLASNVIKSFLSRGLCRLRQPGCVLDELLRGVLQHSRGLEPAVNVQKADRICSGL